MSIHFVSGKPGAGKSYYALTKIVDELRFTKRNIVTNLALKRGELAQYLHTKHGSTFDLLNRLKTLDTDEVGEFWRHYSPGLRLTATHPVKMPSGRFYDHIDYAERFRCCKEDCPNFGRIPDLETRQGKEGKDADKKRYKGCPPDHRIMPGVLYVLDEIHEFFNARNWQETGQDALHYLSQHRKLNDDVYCITQELTNVDKQFRSVTQSFIYLRNLSKEKLPLLGGLIKAPNVIYRSTYLQPYTGTQRAMETRTVHLDIAGMANCYETASGVGIEGGGAEIEKRVGLPWWTILIALGFLWLMLVKGPDWVAAKVAGKGTKVDKIYAGQTASAPAPAAVVATSAPPVVVASAAVTNEPPVVITGVSAIGRTVRVRLSDGRTLTERDINYIDRNAVVAGDETFRVKGGGMIGIPGMLPASQKVTQRNQAAPAVEPANTSSDTVSPPGSAMIPRAERTQWKEPAWQNLPMRGLAVP